MTFVTGDLHGDFRRLEHFCQRMNLGPNDILIVLGESGINFGAPARNAACRWRRAIRKAPSMAAP